MPMSGCHIVRQWGLGDILLHLELGEAMESAVVRYDGTVRTSNNNIIQFRYGEGKFILKTRMNES